jgi:hypothetical protein
MGRSERTSLVHPSGIWSDYSRGGPRQSAAEKQVVASIQSLIVAVGREALS